MAYVPQRFHVVRRIGEKASVEGVGACMAVRRSTLTAVGGFDEELGVGARLCSAEDTDIAVRALLAGFYVCETPDAAVWHHGFRNWSVAQLVVHGYMVGLGAANAKMLRLGKAAGHSTDRRVGLAVVGQGAGRGLEPSSSPNAPPPLVPSRLSGGGFYGFGRQGALHSPSRRRPWGSKCSLAFRSRKVPITIRYAGRRHLHDADFADVKSHRRTRVASRTACIRESPCLGPSRRAKTATPRPRVGSAEARETTAEETRPCGAAPANTRRAA